MTHPIKSPRKLIEVALPLDAINEAAAQEKGNPFLKGHPRNLHQWWARRPMAVARAVLFAQLVNDPGYQQGGGFKYGKNKKAAAIERKRLFKIIEELVLWENTTNEGVLERARIEIQRSWREVCELNQDHPQATELFNPDKHPLLHDPFAGGGAIPLEAQRLGLSAYASDLNPVAVIINKAMIEIPPRFACRAPVGPELDGKAKSKKLGLTQLWPGATGLAEDVRRYGGWMRDEAERRLGHLYPPVEITAEVVRERPDLKPLMGQKLTVIAWIWARTVKSPNPAFCHVDVPLAATFVLSAKSGKEAYVQPVVEGDRYRFIVKTGAITTEAQSGTKLSGRGANFRCVVSDAPIGGDYIKAEGRAGRMGAKLMAIVAEGARGRIYLSPTAAMENSARTAEAAWKPDVEFFQQALGFRVGNYGLTKWSDLFIPRQLAALAAFTDLISEVHEKIRYDAVSSGMSDDRRCFDAGGIEASAYADAVALLLGLGISKAADYNNTLCTWNSANQNIGHLFTKQAIPMAWDFPETTLLTSGLSFAQIADGLARTIEKLPSQLEGVAFQCDCQAVDLHPLRIISTDPPYYDNIGYADLSDFFYVWLRRSLKPIFPRLFETVTTPKMDEIVATPHRHGGTEKAEAFFMQGMTIAMSRLAEAAHPAFPMSIYYAFKQSDTGSEGTASAGWISFLEAVFRAGLVLDGTWPMRTERAQRSRGIGSNALASSIVLVCRKRPNDAPTISRREFIRELNAALPEALDEMTKGSGDDRSPVAPVDMSQAIIGPGMAVFSKYAAVLEADGTSMSVRMALQLINRFLAEDDFDADTQFCLHWFEQHGWSAGRFGDADTLSRAKGTSVDGVRDAGVVESGGGIVRLRKWSEYPADWDPQADMRQPVWETLHHLIRALKQDGETGAGGILAAVKGKAEATRQLAYRLYTLCERQGWPEDARAYNELITSWAGIESAAGAVASQAAQGTLFE